MLLLECISNNPLCQCIPQIIRCVNVFLEILMKVLFWTRFAFRMLIFNVIEEPFVAVNEYTIFDLSSDSYMNSNTFVASSDDDDTKMKRFLLSISHSINPLNIS